MIFDSISVVMEQKHVMAHWFMEKSPYGARRSLARFRDSYYYDDTHTHTFSLI